MKKWILLLAFIIIFGSSYAIASSINESSLLSSSKKTFMEDTEDDVYLKDSLHRFAEITTNDERMEHNNFSFIEDLFFHKDVYIGDEEHLIVATFGDPNDQGMYEGGRFYDYGDRTYFVNPDKRRINAIAVPGNELKEICCWEQVEQSLEDKLIVKEYNELDELWMEIYDVNLYDLMIERLEEGEEAHYLWIMEDSLFIEP